MKRVYGVLAVILVTIVLVALLTAKDKTEECESCAIDQETLEEYYNPTIITPSDEPEGTAEPSEEESGGNVSIVTAYVLRGTMANGEQVHDGAIACPREIELGTQVEVEGMGVYTCKDRTHIKYNGRYDIWMSEYDDAIQFGKRELSIGIL